MTWQDELRQLDEELAAGRLSAEDYRRQRDELLSQTASKPSGPAGTPSAGQPASGPFPPPFRWDQAPAESTQVMSPIRDEPGGSDTTQVVPGREGAGTDAERTQVVPGATRPPQQPGMPPGAPGTPGTAGMSGGTPVMPGAQGQPGPVLWQQGGDQAPPWGGMELPPTTDTTPAWFKQGPEVFEADGGGSRAMRVLGVIGVVLVLVAISVGAYYFFRPDPAPANGPAAVVTSTSQPPAATTTSAKPEGPPIAELPGTATDTSRVKSFTDVEAINYLTPQEIDAYKSTRAGTAKLAISNEGDNRIIVLVTQQADAAGAARTRDALNDLQLRFKLAKLTAQPGVLSTGSDAVDPGPLRRAHYASGRYVVRIQVQGITKSEVDRLYSEVLGIQLDELPADA